LAAVAAAHAKKSEAIDLLTEHIDAVVGHCAGRVHSWDVVNEAIVSASAAPRGLRETLWSKSVGAEYIRIAFQAAARADPSAILAYNDYGLEMDNSGAKRDAVLGQLRSLCEKNTPIKALGLQSHLKVSKRTQTWESLRRFLKEIEKLGLSIFITELDVDDAAFKGTRSERNKQVAEVYRTFLNTVLECPSVKVVITWGLSDRMSWLQRFGPKRPDEKPKRPLPFDSRLQGKPSFYAMTEAISHAEPR
jgi:endo-1,4-beta-xylanase